MVRMDWKLSTSTRVFSTSLKSVSFRFTQRDSGFSGAELKSYCRHLVQDLFVRSLRRFRSFGALPKEAVTRPSNMFGSKATIIKKRSYCISIRTL
jgi:hypothetical protein